MQLKRCMYISWRKRFFGNQFSRAVLAVASLLAPVCRPAGYGLDCPSFYPEPLAQFIEELSDKLAWVDLMYEQHR